MSFVYVDSDNERALDVIKKHLNNGIQHEDKWDGTALILVHIAKSVEAGGADFLIICTNTLYKIAIEIEAQISIKILHIADAAVNKFKIVKHGRFCIKYCNSRIRD